MNKVFVGIALCTYLDNPHKIQFLPGFNYGMALLMTYHIADSWVLPPTSISLNRLSILHMNFYHSLYSILQYLFARKPIYNRKYKIEDH